MRPITSKLKVRISGSRPASAPVLMMLNEEEKLKRKISEHPKRVISVDIDGTLSEYKHWKGYLHLGKPIKKVVDLIRKERRAGAYIIIHSCRTTSADNEVYFKSIDYMKRWLKRHKIPYDSFWSGCGKPYSNAYIDDKAVNPNCECCMKEISK